MTFATRLVLLLALCASSCTGSAGTPATGGEPRPFCAGGAVVFCRCTDGTSGKKRCRSDGSGFGLCGPCDGTGASLAAPVCGDGSVDDGEDCDDGNARDGDGCSSACLLEASVSPGEVCPGIEVELGAGDVRSLTGDTRGRRDDEQGTCAGAGQPDVVYTVRATQAGRLRVTIEGAAFSTHVRKGGCAPSQEVACSTEGTPALDLAEGDVAHVVLEGPTTGAAYAIGFSLETTSACEAGSICDTGKLGVCAAGRIECGPQGTVCVQANLARQSDDCGNGLDDDCNGVLDDGVCAACAHGVCDQGPALSASCDPCVTAICKADWFCCSGGTWDSACMGYVRSVCGRLDCASGHGACGHSLCVVGERLSPGCDGSKLWPSCVDQLCAADSFCCEEKWDEACVAKVAEVCGLTCP